MSYGFQRQSARLPGIRGRNRRQAFMEQIIESIRRGNSRARLNGARSAPHAPIPGTCFDPLRPPSYTSRKATRTSILARLHVRSTLASNGGGDGATSRIYGRFGEGGRWDGQHQRDVDRFSEPGFTPHRS